MNKYIKLSLSLVLIVLMSLLTLNVKADSEFKYYVCFSTQNYALRNANVMTLNSNGDYELDNVTMTGATQFYVSDGYGTQYYASSGAALSPSETLSYSYNIYFNPNKIYDASTSQYKATGCHITYGFYVPLEVTIKINDVETAMTYNPYVTTRQEYYISSVYLEKGSVIIYQNDDLLERHEMTNDGYYRILFTPGTVTNNNTYLYNEKGDYGTGEDYTYYLYIADAPQYYVTLVSEVIADSTDVTINDEAAYLLTRDESQTLTTFTGSHFFISNTNYTLRYRLYEQDSMGNNILIDDDNDNNTTFSSVTVTDVGWYCFNVVENNGTYTVTAKKDELSLDDYYLMGTINHWLYTDKGELNCEDTYKFSEVLEGDSDYTEDYTQYKLTLKVTAYDLKNGDIEFYISNGTNTFRNNGLYITISEAGTYEILCAPDHVYGRARNYKYTNTDKVEDKEEVVIYTAQDYVDFANKCNENSDYSEHLTAYLASDLNFSHVDFVPIRVFKGTFKGGYHSLNNITISEECDIKAVFGTITRNATVERLTVHLTIDSADSNYVGFISKNYGTVKDINMYGNVTGGQYVGVIGYNGRTLETTDGTTNIYFDAVVSGIKNNMTITGQTHVGLVGFNNGELRDSENYGTITGYTKANNTTPSNIGGIAGYSSGLIIGCTNNGKVTMVSSSANVGGIVGLSTGEIYYTVNKGAVQGTKYVGGICGYYGTISNNHEDLTTLYGGMSYEELIAYFNADQDGDYEQIEGRNHDMCYNNNSGSVSALNNAGGILGYTQTSFTVECCVNSGHIAITAGSYVGGIGGYLSNATVRSCTSCGIIEASGLIATYVGGICGYAESIYYSYSNATLKGKDYMGGISGYVNSYLENCYSNVLINVDSSSQHIGDISGACNQYNEGLSTFNDYVSNNFYVGTIGGIGRCEYTESYAAVKIEPLALASIGMISSSLPKDFAGDYYVAYSDTELYYPVFYYFEEVKENSLYSDSDEWSAYFTQYKDSFQEEGRLNAQVLVTISFMEWNSTLGELSNEHCEIIDSIRIPYHTTITTYPTFTYAKDGKYVTDYGTYFVSYTDLDKVYTENSLVYPEYIEQMTTLEDKEDTILVEGYFKKGTTVSLKKIINGYYLEFMYEGEAQHYDSVVLKFKKADTSKSYYILDANNNNLITSTNSDDYLRFIYQDNVIFTVNKVSIKALPTWAIVVIGVLGGMIVSWSTMGIISATKKKKAKKQTEQKAVENNISETTK